MGSIWLEHLPWWIQGAGLEVDTWPGWETRSRSSGGYDAIHAIGVHHTAGGGTLDGNSQYCWNNASARPIGAMLLAPDGRIRVGAAGATNTQGRGGPTTTSKGTTPKDAGNRYWVSIEAMNRGDGTPWPEAQQEAYVRLCRVLCSKLGLNPSSDVLAHFEWTTRKVDPAGQSRYASGGNKWNMPSFRADIAQSTPPPKPPPTSGGTPDYRGGEYGLQPYDTGKPTLRRGSPNTGDKIKYLQGVLKNEGGYTLDISGSGYGTFGPQTEAAVKALQQKHGVAVDGIVGWDGSGTSPGKNATWPIVDKLALASVEPPPPPTKPPPTGGGDLDLAVSTVTPCKYYVRDGDSPWTATERLFGSGSKWATYFTESQFAKPYVHVSVKTTKGKSTKVGDGEGPYAVLDRMGIDRGRLNTFYDWNGGKDRTLHPGDRVYMPL